MVWRADNWRRGDTDDVHHPHLISADLVRYSPTLILVIQPQVLRIQRTEVPPGHSGPRLIRKPVVWGDYVESRSVEECRKLSWARKGCDTSQKSFRIMLHYYGNI